MLQDKFLPKFHFNEVHSIPISAPAGKVYSIIRKLEFSHSRIIRMLFWLRGLRGSKTRGIDWLLRMGFCLLEEKGDKEIILGLIGQFWKPHGNLQQIEPSDFGRPWPGFAKAVWNFEIKSKSESELILKTETRIACEDERTRKKFGRYWFFIKPFSGIIRKQILRSVKRKAELSC